MLTIADTLIEKGREAGMLQTAREYVLEFLNVRFSKIPQTITTFIRNFQEMPVLKELLRKAVQVESLEEFQRLLDDVPKQSEESNCGA